MTQGAAAPPPAPKGSSGFGEMIGNGILAGLKHLLFGPGTAIALGLYMILLATVFELRPDTPDAMQWSWIVNVAIVIYYMWVHNNAAITGGSDRVKAIWDMVVSAFPFLIGSYLAVQHMRGEAGLTTFEFFAVLAYLGATVQDLVQNLRLMMEIMFRTDEMTASRH